ncbi:Rv1535 domain-containing protein [Nocardia veterana]|nr:Rv1535 domain-containing protein [Nocardia veterana]
MRFSDVAGSDPLTGALTQLLTVPVRELYAVLWRIGVIDVESAR